MWKKLRYRDGKQDEQHRGLAKEIKRVEICMTIDWGCVHLNVNNINHFIQINKKFLIFRCSFKTFTTNCAEIVNDDE